MISIVLRPDEIYALKFCDLPQAEEMYDGIKSRLFQAAGDDLSAQNAYCCLREIKEVLAEKHEARRRVEAHRHGVDQAAPDRKRR